MASVSGYDPQTLRAEIAAGEAAEATVDPAALLKVRQGWLARLRLGSLMAPRELKSFAPGAGTVWTRDGDGLAVEIQPTGFDAPPAK